MPRSRTLLSLAMAGLVIALVGGPMSAHSGDGDTHRGVVGRHAFRDSEDGPGARCRYMQAAPTDTLSAQVSVELSGVTVRPPKVAAIDRTRWIDRQPVAWRFVLQERIGDGEWTVVKRSRLQVRWASDRRAADFSRLRVRYDGDPTAEYRVKTKAFWLKKRNPLRKVGVAAHLVDYYRVRAEVAMSSCPGGISPAAA